MIITKTYYHQMFPYHFYAMLGFHPNASYQILFSLLHAWGRLSQHIWQMEISWPFKIQRWRLKASRRVTKTTKP